MFKKFIRRAASKDRFFEHARNNLQSVDSEDKSIYEESAKEYNPNAPLKSRLKWKDEKEVLCKPRSTERRTPDFGESYPLVRERQIPTRDFRGRLVDGQNSLQTKSKPLEQFFFGAESTAKTDPFIKYLAYESACQACLCGMKSGPRKQALLFLKDNCEGLKKALKIDSFLTMSRLLNQNEGIKDKAEQDHQEESRESESEEDERMVTLRATRIKIPTAEENEDDIISFRNSTARQRDIQLKCGEEMVMNPCSRNGRCVSTSKDLRLPFNDAVSCTVTAVYLEDGRVIAKGDVTAKHLIKLSENSHQKKEEGSYSETKKSRRNSAKECESLSPRRSPASKIWIELTDSLKNALHLCLAVDIVGYEEHTSAEMTSPQVLIEMNRTKREPSPFCYRSKYQAFQYIFECFCERDSCSNSLEIDEDYLWLLRTYSRVYGISENYHHLIHLSWIFKTKSPPLTEYCLSFILEKFQLIRTKRIGSMESTILKLSSEIETLCGRVLENYFRLDEDSESGISETNWCSEFAEHPPCALKPTVQLLSNDTLRKTGNSMMVELLSDAKKLELQSWYEGKLKTAALVKYRQIGENCRVEEEAAFCEEKTGSESSKEEERLNNRDDATAKNLTVNYQVNKQDFYNRVKRICTSLIRDLERDFRIHESGILPPEINLPYLTASIYRQELKSQFLSILEQNPPECIDPIVVEMFLAIGAFNEYVETKFSKENHPSLGINPLETFSHFIDDWIQHFVSDVCEISQGAFVQHQMLDISEGDRVPFLLNHVLNLLEAEMLKYEKLLRTWSSLGPTVERAICDVLRHVINIISQECHMFKRDQNLDYSPFSRKQGLESSGYGCWEWKGILDFYDCNELLSSSQMMLLHSLRRLLVEIPHFEDTLNSWMSSSKEEIKFGYEFGLFVQELRSQFSNAIMFSAERLMVCYSIGYDLNMITLLQQLDYTFPQGASAADTKSASSGYLEYIKNGLLELRLMLEDRVLVGLVRGLWDNLSRELFLFIVELKEDQNNKAWISRTNCSFLIEIVDTFFKTTLNEIFPHSLIDSDSLPPLHARKSREMLADNTKALNNSFSVY